MTVQFRNKSFEYLSVYLPHYFYCTVSQFPQNVFMLASQEASLIEKKSKLANWEC